VPLIHYIAVIKIGEDKERERERERERDKVFCVV